MNKFPRNHSAKNSHKSVKNFATREKLRVGPRACRTGNQLDVTVVEIAWQNGDCDPGQPDTRRKRPKRLSEVHDSAQEYNIYHKDVGLGGKLSNFFDIKSEKRNVL